MKSTKNKLLELYLKSSKHSQYQYLTNELDNLLDSNCKITKSRFEIQRLNYIKSKVETKDKRILDIGGNTGYFSIELTKNTNKLTYIEGNKNHTEFVKLASNYLKLTKKINIINDYYNFNKLDKQKYDIVLLLNVLHHIGDDFDNKEISINKAKKTIIKYINSFHLKTDILILQIGYNWKGNINNKLFKKGTKKEVIKFIENGTKKYWNIQSIGIATNNKNIEYKDLDNKNINREDSLGEFLNRPIFILKLKN